MNVRSLFSKLGTFSSPRSLNLGRRGNCTRFWSVYCNTLLCNALKADNNTYRCIFTKVIEPLKERQLHKFQVCPLSGSRQSRRILHSKINKSKIQNKNFSDPRSLNLGRKDNCTSLRSARCLGLANPEVKSTDVFSYYILML